jgi:hypothetical protein
MRQADPGLQPQRTALAWNRTALATAINALLMLRAGMQTGGRALLAVGVLVGIAAGVMAWTAARRSRQLARQASGPSSALMVLTSAVVVLAACGGLGAMLR